MAGKWHLNRAGIINYWYYQESYFEFANGKMLLRGSNGSGKSVTTASLLPMLLDGKTHPKRLDPFGSNARKIEDYLLGEKEISGDDERTGYLMLEYKREGEERYITTGIGMQARRNNRMQKWYFIIMDDKRVGIDFELWKKEGADGKRPLSKKELENRVSGDSRVVSSRQEYAELVNRHLFGFETMDGFEDMVHLLVELRKPKLSKDFTPNVMYRLLEEALPPLKDDALQSVSESLGNIDAAQAELEQARHEYKILKELGKTYQKYQQLVLGRLAKYWMETQKLLVSKEQTLVDAQTKVKAAQFEVEHIGQEITTSETKMAMLLEEENSLREHNVFRLVKEQKDLEVRMKNLRASIEKSEETLHRKKSLYITQQNRLEQLEVEFGNKERDLKGFLAELVDHAESSGFKEHEVMLDTFTRLKAEMNMSYWHKEAGKHQSNLLEIKMLVQERGRITQELSDIDRQIGTVEQERDKQLYFEKDWLNIFDDEMEKLETELLEWKEQAGFEIVEETWQESLQRLHQLYDKTGSFYDVMEPFRLAFRMFEDMLGKEILVQEFAVEHQKQELIHLQSELEKWQTTRFAEPMRAELASVEREELKESGTKISAFYELVDFHENVSQNMRNQLESALSEMGVMDALVSEQKLALTANRQLISSPLLNKNTLDQFLYPIEAEASIDTHYVASILQSIEVVGSEKKASSTTMLTKDGAYQIGIIDGQSLNDYEAKFIGKENQERYRLCMIADLEEQIRDREQELQVLSGKIITLKQCIAMEKSRFETIPDSSDLQEADRKIKDTRVRIGRLDLELQNLRVKSQESKEAYSKVDITLKQWQKTIDIELTEQGISGCMNAITDYMHALGDLRSTSEAISNMIHQKTEYTEQMELLQEELNELVLEVDEKQSDDLKLDALLQSINSQLELEGEQDIRAKMNACFEEKAATEKRLKGLRNDLPKYLSELKSGEDDTAKYQMESDFYKRLTESWRNLFIRECSRYQGVTSEQVGDEAKKLQASCNEEEEARVRNRLNRMLKESMLDLSVYNPTLYDSERMPLEDWMGSKFFDYLEPKLNEWKQAAVRQLLEVTDEQGRRVSIFDMLEDLDDYIRNQESFVNEEDHRLFEDILLHSIGNILRQLINRAEKWAVEMNKILMGQQNSSGLRLSIDWQAKTAEEEGELDTKDLVKLLRREATTLSDEEVSQMVRHFRSKIDYAKVTMEENEEIQSLHDVMKTVLDYRKWFRFVLSYQKENETKRELTNHKFYQFSGGEKAISMYLPLFTAVYSRYKDAKIDAPYIIALDEAFAGIDELNIAELFKATEALEFDYILNSQSLWGDYATVTDLNIYQLLRMKNASHVSHLLYHWNGKERTLIGELEDEAETIG
ncbi:TIGR02680 family protein [Listeria booriae]|uniref:TIGR02680 family protein n=1 Tax=Listeria booriae TaxID=1552123 RepID=UPI001623328E|nr:TIGR02680 family protein [Listeria booriae]MBC2180818.1 TIGR02680 family protein [Listeria booriae]